MIFSTATLFNALNNRWFWNENPGTRIYVAGLLGIVGLIAMFWNELTLGNWSLDALRGLGLGLLGTYLFSLGNMVSIRNNRRKLHPLTTNAYSMIYGTLILAAAMLLSGTPVLWDPHPSYIGSLLYLAVFGTIIAFWAYLTLVARIGANKAAYATVLFPVVALTLSSVFEDYQWSAASVAGLLLVLAGNVVLLELDRPFYSSKAPGGR